MPRLPTGTVTFLFTDIEGSTQLLERLADAYGESLKTHDAILRRAVAAYSGVVFETVGDAVYAAFTRPTEAIACALDAQLGLSREKWGEIGEVRVRMGIHTGEVELRGDHYFGRALYRCARLMAIGYGGQILVSSVTASLVRNALPSGTSLRALGTHRLKDLGEPEEPYQLEHAELIADFPPLKSLNARPNNLPVEVSTFVGRDAELSQVRRLLDNTRLLTITGPGGSGKTRLALQVGAEMIDSLADGVFFVALASVSEPWLVLSEIARVLHVRETAGQPLAERLKERVSRKQLLIVLDNFEQVASAAPLVADLLGGAPTLKILVTSRAPLRIAGEQEYPLPPLQLPDMREPARLEHLAEYGAIQLFAARAAEVAPDFVLTSANVATVAEICQRVDALPLAIELAAARIKLLDPDSLLRRLDHSLGILVAGRRDAPARQKTLRGAIAWSYDLLGESGRELFRRLAVFAGGFTVEAAEAVSGPEHADDMLEAISILVENSLVRHEKTLGERFSMLVTIREYALEQREADQSAGEVRQRHAEYFLALAERVRNVASADRLAEYDRLEADHENLRAAIEWAVLNQDAHLGLRLAAAAFPFWEQLGHWGEGVTLLRSVLALPDAGAATTERAAALYALGSLATYRGDLPAAQSALEDSVRLWRALHEGPGLVEALTNLGNVYAYRGDYARFAAITEEALQLARSVDFREVGDLLHNLGTARMFAGDLEGGRLLLEQALRQRDHPVTRSILGELERMSGDYGRSTESLENVLRELREQRQDIYMAPTLAALALTKTLTGDLPRARVLCSEGLATARRLGHQFGLALGLDVMAILDVERGRAASAARLFGAAEALRARTDMAVWEPARVLVETARERVRRELGEKAFTAALDEGRGIPLERALAQALEPFDATER